jgi:hypothetical protein
LFRFKRTGTRDAVRKVNGRTRWKSLATDNVAYAKRLLAEEKVFVSRVDWRQARCCTIHELIETYRQNPMESAASTLKIRNRLLKVFERTWKYGFGIGITIRESFVHLRKLFPGGALWRGADLQSAVSPNCIRRNVVFAGGVRFGCGQRITNPRYGRIQFCATSVAAAPRCVHPWLKMLLSGSERIFAFCPRQIFLHHQQVTAFVPAVVQPKIFTVGVVGEQKNIALLNFSPVQPGQTGVHKSFAQALVAVSRCHREVMERAAPSIMPAQNRSDNFAAARGHEAHARIAPEIAANVAAFVRFVQADAFGALPQPPHGFVIGQGQGANRVIRFHGPRLPVFFVLRFAIYDL